MYFSKRFHQTKWGSTKFGHHTRCWPCRQLCVFFANSSLHLITYLTPPLGSSHLTPPLGSSYLTSTLVSSHLTPPFGSSYLTPPLGSSLTQNVDLYIACMFSTKGRQKYNVMSNCTLFWDPKGVSGLICLELYSFRRSLSFITEWFPHNLFEAFSVQQGRT